MTQYIFRIPLNQFTDLSASSFKWLCCFRTLRKSQYRPERYLSWSSPPHLGRGVGMLLMMKKLVFLEHHLLWHLPETWLVSNNKQLSSHGLTKEWAVLGKKKRLILGLWVLADVIVTSMWLCFSALHRHTTCSHAQCVAVEMVAY